MLNVILCCEIRFYILHLRSIFCESHERLAVKKVLIDLTYASVECLTQSKRADITRCVHKILTPRLIRLYLSHIHFLVCVCVCTAAGIRCVVDLHPLYKHDVNHYTLIYRLGVG